MTMPPSASTPPPPPLTPPPGRVTTGIANLDDILGGGLPEHQIHLILGDPGVGKTTLALQFLLAGARHGETCLYLTLAEGRSEIERMATVHGWKLDGIEVIELGNAEALQAAAQRTTLFHPSEVELQRTTTRMIEAIERFQPRRLVLDSLSEVRLMAQGPLRYRRQILALKAYLETSRTSALLIDDRRSDESTLEAQKIAQGIISLEKTMSQHGAERRRLIVDKLRASAFRGGYHDFLIRTGGIEVFPRLVAAEHRQRYASEQISSGIAAVDQLLGGGLDRGTSNLLLGPAGVGKSVLATQYALAAAERGQQVEFYTFDESERTILERSRGLGLEMDRHVASGRIIIHQIDSAEMSPGEMAYHIRTDVQQKDVRLVVIDSLNGYLHAMPEERFLVIQLHELLTFLGQQGVTTLMVMAQHGFLGSVETPVDVTYIADTVIALRYFESQGSVRKALSVVKKRSGIHEATIRELHIQRQAIRVGEPLHEFEGILTGTPRFLGAASAMLPSSHERKPR